MSCDRTTSFTSLSTARAAAVEEPLGRTWEQCAGQRESEAPLSGLDDAVYFGDDFPEPIRYDAARGVLRYRGLMSHGSFRYLGGLSRDYRYQRALEQLFVATATLPAAGPPWTVWLGAAAAAVVLVGAAWFGISRFLLRDGTRPLAPKETMTAGSAAGGRGRRDVSPPGKQVDESSAAAQDRER